MASISDKIPVFKKKVSSFIAKDDGKISKKSLIKAGILASVISLVSENVASHDDTHTNACSAIIAAPDAGYQDPFHSNSLALSYDSGTATGTHSHCAGPNSHASHASHGSHSSHSSACSGIDW